MALSDPITPSTPPADAVALDWALIARYLANELSAEERERVERWAEQDPRRLRELTVLRRIWRQAGELPSASRLRAMWEAIVRRRAATVQLPTEERSQWGPL